MPYTPQFGTGFEMGTMFFAAGETSGDVRIVDSPVHTSTYALLLNYASWAQFTVSGSPSELYLAVWCRSTDLSSDGVIRITILLADGNTVEIRPQSYKWNAYVGGANVATGSHVFPSETWMHIQLYVKISDSDGVIQLITDGMSDIDYSGDTKPGASSAIAYIRFQNYYAGNSANFDDFTFGAGGWPGDIRFDCLVPNADTATKDWTPSTGSDNYAMVDERPASDADYVYSALTGDQDLYALADWDASGKVPAFVMQWARAWKDEAAAHQMKLLLGDGVNLVVGSAQDLYTSARYVNALHTLAPDGGAWADEDLDALQVGQESVIV